MRKPFVGGNWKMNLDGAAARTLADDVARAVAADKLDRACDVAIFPPFVYLPHVFNVLRDRSSSVMLGAQDFWPEPNGAFTGEVSLAQLKDCGVQVVLAGHSERRHVIGEGDELINRKTRAALAAGFAVILCIGEKLDERAAGKTDEVNQRQLRAGLAGVPIEHAARLTIAYEPVWAIGTGKNATPADAQAAQAKVRSELGSIFSPEAASRIRIQYGGSMKAGNAAETLAQNDVDGGLIGGASLKADEFVAIVSAAAAAPRGR
ncbi:MAG: triose-phosphate isomerase [Phycisphaeraceae bacterium]|nr:triose-phosphate isomerase [Phycisphaeraceae bacterium]MBX3405584.1 triose-phosphate isomerase [Phycisphaeraceae bacterium]